MDDESCHGAQLELSGVKKGTERFILCKINKKVFLPSENLF
jgi:hypothetical protein